MNLNYSTNNIPLLDLTSCSLAGFVSEPHDCYWNARYVFEMSRDEFLFETIEHLKGKDVPENIYLFAPYNTKNCQYVRFIAIANTDGEVKIRAHLQFNFVNWEGRKPLQVFITKLAKTINQSTDLSVYNINRDLDSVEIMVDCKLESERTIGDTISSLLFTIKTYRELL